MAVGDLHHLEETGQRAVLARPAVGDVQHHVRLHRGKPFAYVAADIDAGNAVATPFQGIGAGRAGSQRHLALGRPAAHEDGDMRFGHGIHP